MDLSIRVIALILCVTKVTSHQDTHTYRLFKLLKITCPNRPFRPPEAEKRDYEALPTSRQAFQLNFFSLLPLPQPPENPAAAEEVRII